MLTSDIELSQREKDIIIPAKGYVKRSGRFWSSQERWELKEGPIIIRGYEALDLKEKIPKRGVPVVLSTEFNPFKSEPSTSFQRALWLYAGEEVEQYFKHAKYERLDTSYAEALALLGLEAPAEFKEAHEREQHQKKLHIISRLRELRAEENTKKRRDEIQRYAREAIELRMHEGDLTLELEPGVKLNVPEYISSICRQYGMEEVKTMGDVLKESWERKQ